METKELVLFCIFLLSRITICFSQTCPTGCSCSGGYVTCTVADQSSFPVFPPSGATYNRLIITDTNRWITTLDDGGFDDLKITDLRIHGTGITRLACETFKGLESSVTHLYLKNNSISDISACAFRGLLKLYHLDLDENELTKLTVDSFPGLPLLRNLLLQNNDISTIEDRTFDISPYLDKVDLRNNLLTSTVWSALNSSHSYFGRLRHLYLDGNSLEMVPAYIFSSAPVITFLTLRNCSLNSFPWENLSPKRYFYALNLENNFLTSFGTEISPVTLGFRGSVFNISSNLLTTLNVNFTWIASTYNIRQILAADNKLTSANFIVYPTAKETTSVIRVDLRDNKIDSTFNFSMKTDSVSNTDFTILLDNNKVKGLNIFPIIVERIEYGVKSLWDPCATSKSPSNNIDVSELSLRGNGIVSIDPRSCLTVAKTVDLSVNNLTRFDLHSAALERRLSTLDLSSNQIKDVCLENMTLSVVDLSGNLISMLPDFSRSLVQQRFRSLILTGNPIHCDCTVFWTRLGDFRDKVIGAICQTPENKIGQNMLSVDLSECIRRTFQTNPENRCLRPPTTTCTTDAAKAKECACDLIIPLAVISGILLLLSIVLVIVLCLVRYNRKCMSSLCSSSSNHGKPTENNTYVGASNVSQKQETIYETPQ